MSIKLNTVDIPYQGRQHYKEEGRLIKFEKKKKRKEDSAGNHWNAWISVVLSHQLHNKLYNYLELRNSLQQRKKLRIKFRKIYRSVSTLKETTSNTNATGCQYIWKYCCCQMFWESDTESIQKSYAQGTLTAVKKVIFQNQTAWSFTSEGFILSCLRRKKRAHKRLIC